MSIATWSKFHITGPHTELADDVPKIQPSRFLKHHIQQRKSRFEVREDYGSPTLRKGDIVIEPETFWGWQKTNQLVLIKLQIYGILELVNVVKVISQSTLLFYFTDKGTPVFGWNISPQLFSSVAELRVEARSSVAEVDVSSINLLNWSPYSHSCSSIIYSIPSIEVIF